MELTSSSVSVAGWRRRAVPGSTAGDENKKEMSYFRCSLCRSALLILFRPGSPLLRWINTPGYCRLVPKAYFVTLKTVQSDAFQCNTLIIVKFTFTLYFRFACMHPCLGDFFHYHCRLWLVHCGFKSTSWLLWRCFMTLAAFSWTRIIHS